MLRARGAEHLVRRIEIDEKNGEPHDQVGPVRRGYCSQRTGGNDCDIRKHVITCGEERGSCQASVRMSDLCEYPSAREVAGERPESRDAQSNRRGHEVRVPSSPG